MGAGRAAPALPLAVVGLPPQDDHADTDDDQRHGQAGVDADAERGEQQRAAEGERAEREQHAEVAFAPDAAEHRVLVADLERGEDPECGVHQEPRAARQGQDDEQHADHEYVDAEVLGEPARDAGELAAHG